MPKWLVKNGLVLKSGNKALLDAAPDTPLLWTPAEISTTAWYDASDAITINEDDAPGFVSQWDDKSGNANHLIQGFGANQPAYGARQINGINILDFTPALQYMNMTTTIAPTGEVHMFAVVEVDALSDQILFGNGGGTKLGMWTVNNTWGFRWSNLAGGVTFSSPAGLNIGAGSPGIWRFYREASNQTYAQKNAELTPYSSGLYSAAGNPQLNRISFNNAQGFDGKVAEVIIVNRVMTIDEIDRIHGYLAWKWGTESSLPIGHPYKNSPPEV